MVVYGMGGVPLLDHRVNVQPLNGQIVALSMLEAALQGRALETPTNLSEADVPNSMSWHGPSEALPDYDLTNFRTVSERARTLIEALEPDRHRFIPVSFVTADHYPLARRFFWLIGNCVDSQDHARTGLVLVQVGTTRVWRSLFQARRRYPDQIPDRLKDAMDSWLVFDKRAVASLHAWHDMYLDNGAVWVSQMFAERWAVAEFTGAKFEPIE